MKIITVLLPFISLLFLGLSTEQLGAVSAAMIITASLWFVIGAEGATNAT